MANAIAAAKEGLKTDLARWTLEEVSGEDGGFVLVQEVTIKISARSGPKPGGKK